jgi:hypothetical protein
MDQVSGTGGRGQSRWRAFLTTRLVIIIAGLVVLAIAGTVIGVSAHTSSLRAREAANQKAAQDASDQKTAQAINDFDGATAACEIAKSALSKAADGATSTATTDPSSLADPTLIDALKAASTENSGATPCAAPVMARDTDAIIAQTTALRVATGVVSTAAATLQNAVDAVATSVTAKADADAAAAAAVAAEAQAAAATAKAAERTWHQDGGNGYTYDVSLAVGAPTTAATGSGGTVGGVCTDFDPAKDIALPITLTATSTTTGFTIPTLRVELYTYAFGGKIHVTDGAWYIGSDIFSANEGGTYEAEEYFSGGNSQCWQPAQGYSSGLLSVTWSDGLEPGAKGVWNIIFIVKGYKNPSHPSGNPALLSGIGISPQLAMWWVPGDKALMLDNTIIAG